VENPIFLIYYYDKFKNLPKMEMPYLERDLSPVVMQVVRCLLVPEWDTFIMFWLQKVTLKNTDAATQSKLFCPITRLVIFLGGKYFVVF
jgi:hypothetical protein